MSKLSYESPDTQTKPSIKHQYESKTPKMSQSRLEKLNNDNNSQPKKAKSNLFFTPSVDVIQKDEQIGSQEFIIHIQMEQEMIEPISVWLGLKANIQDAINSSLEIINQNRIQILCSQDFEMYMVKKNGRPKYDYPAFQSNQLLSKTGTSSFALVNRPIDDCNQFERDSYDQRKTQGESQILNDLPQALDVNKNVVKSQSYNNSLTDLNSPQDSQKEIPLQIKPWFFRIMYCSCSDNKE